MTGESPASAPSPGQVLRGPTAPSGASGLGLTKPKETFQETE